MIGQAAVRCKDHGVQPQNGVFLSRAISGHGCSSTGKVSSNEFSSKRCESISASGIPIPKTPSQLFIGVYRGACARTCRSNFLARVSELNVHLFGIQPGPSRRVETAAEVVERVVRFVVRSTSD